LSTPTKKSPRKLILKIGAILIILSGLVSIAISIPEGAVYNEVDPNEIFGHIGIVNGSVAVIIGVFLLWFSRLSIITPFKTILAGIMMVVLGHIGAIAGALLVGTAGVLLCYIAGVWSIVIGTKQLIITK
jgi:hypothetical protein